MSITKPREEPLIPDKQTASTVTLPDDKDLPDDSPDAVYHYFLQKIARDPKALRMKKYIQHGNVTTYDHCLHVTRLSWKLAQKFQIFADKREGRRERISNHLSDLAERRRCRRARVHEELEFLEAAFLHDYYLYDWHTHGDHLHGYRHPAIAARNAARDFGLDERHQQIIRTHMWPLTLFHVPSGKEAWIITMADKICSARETVQGRIEKKYITI